MNNDIKTALITFHAAYNYGSVLQAYVLQNVITSLGYENTIINYRFQNQKDCYKLIRKTSNLVDVIKDLLQFPVFCHKRKRQLKFEEFINQNLRLTEEVNQPEELEFIKEDYDLFISGSDQIWNKHANELHSIDWKYMQPYLLTFTPKAKISYASSFGGTTDAEIEENILGYIKNFSNISVREVSAGLRLEKLLGRKIESVLDPTLLWRESDYVERFELVKKQEPYIFYYSLSGIKTVIKHLKWIKNMVRNSGIKVMVNTPYAYVPLKKPFFNYVDMGPTDFIGAIYSAEYVITDSFHGTAFSVNFNKNFYAICKKEGASEYRKEELLQRLGLASRLIYDLEETTLMDRIDYSNVNRSLDELRKKSMSYLCCAMQSL